jgi:outer membrane protein
MKKILALIFSLIMMVTLSSAFAAPDKLKVGIIDMTQILQKSTLMMSLNNDLIKKFQARQDDIVNANKQLQDETNKLQYNNSTMSDADITNLQNKILADKANIQILTASFQRDLQIAKDAAMQTFMAKFNQVINQIAKTGGYDIIEQRRNLAYVNNDLDITNDVLKQL